MAPDSSGHKVPRWTLGSLSTAASLASSSTASSGPPVLHAGRRLLCLRVGSAGFAEGHPGRPEHDGEGPVVMQRTQLRFLPWSLLPALRRTRCIRLRKAYKRDLHMCGCCLGSMFKSRFLGRSEVIVPQRVTVLEALVWAAWELSQHLAIVRGRCVLSGDGY